MPQIPRRVYLERLSPAELSIREAIIAVERLPANERLTDAVIHLINAFNAVADFIDFQEAETQKNG